MSYQVFNMTRQAPKGKYDEKRLCEDSSISVEEDGKHILAVADGHGASECTMAYKGSEFACRAAAQKLSSFADQLAKEDREEEFLVHPGRFVRQVINAIVTQWTHDCLNDHALSGGEPDTAENVLLKYGTTLICAVMTERWLLMLQQGDGRAFVVCEDGSGGEVIPWDDRCAENRTTSMCDSDAVSSMRYQLIDLRSQSVAAVYLETDGVEDCFDSLEYNLAWLNHFVTFAYRNHADGLLPYIAAYLDRMTGKGSHDDITLAALVNMEAMNKQDAAYQAKCQELYVKTENAKRIREAAEFRERLNYRMQGDYEKAEKLWRRLVRNRTVPTDLPAIAYEIEKAREHMMKTFELIFSLHAAYANLPAGLELPLAGACQSEEPCDSTPPEQAPQKAAKPIRVQPRKKPRHKKKHKKGSR